MKTRVALTAFGFLATIALLCLTACTGGPSPIVTETPSATAPASPSPSPSPSPSASASLAPLTDAELLALMPPDAAYPDVRGAIATAEYFVAQFPIMFETGDLRVWDALSGPDCQFCASMRGIVVEESAAGSYETGGALSVDQNSIVANYFEADGFTYVNFNYVQEPSILHHADGTIEPNGDGGPGVSYFRMSLVDGVWRVLGVETTAS